MGLKKIREQFLSLKMTINETRVSLRHAGIEPKAADELMSLWVTDEWERSVKHGPGTGRGNGGRR